jgi:hypothetical protein
MEAKQHRVDVPLQRIMKIKRLKDVVPKLSARFGFVRSMRR